MPDPIPDASPTTRHPNPGRSHDLAAEWPWLIPTLEPDGTAGIDQTTNPDCLALGCDWDWGTGRCACGQLHTFRTCRRCLFSDDPVCAADEDPDDSAVTA
jgi:hypothetical protein